MTARQPIMGIEANKTAGRQLRPKSAKKNYVYNVLYQVLLLIVPLVTTPYISRVIGVDGVGQYSYAYSLITYFTLFAALGFGYYAQREIAAVREDAHARSILFWEVTICRLVPTVLCLAVNLALCFTNVYGDESGLMLVMSCGIAAVAIDCSFYFQGMEDFGKIVLRNTIVKILTVAMIFIFVNSPDDVWLYALLNLGMTAVGNATLWIGLPGYLVKVRAGELRPFRHMPGTLRLFIPTIVISIYTVLDKTLIGVITQSDAQNAYYEQADKIVKIALTVVTCLGSVMIPRNTAEYRNGNIEKLRSNIYFASKFVWFLGTALAFGISAVIFNFNTWFFGEGYDGVNSIAVMLSVLCVAIGMSNVIGVQYLVPIGRDKAFTLTVTAGAAVNTLLNIPLIIFFGAFGAAIATVIAECTVTGAQLLYVRKEIQVSRILLGGIKNLIAGGIMFAAILPMSLYFPSGAGYTVLIILTGIAVYCLALVLLRDKFFLENTAQVFSRIRGLLKRNKSSSEAVAASSCENSVSLPSETALSADPAPAPHAFSETASAAHACPAGNDGTKLIETSETASAAHACPVGDAENTYSGNYARHVYRGRYARSRYAGGYPGRISRTCRGRSDFRN